MTIGSWLLLGLAFWGSGCHGHANSKALELVAYSLGFVLWIATPAAAAWCVAKSHIATAIIATISTVAWIGALVGYQTACGA